MASPGIIPLGPTSIKAFIFVVFEGLSDMRFVGLKPFLRGRLGGEWGASHYYPHHRKFDSPNALKPPSGEVPGLAGPEKGLANAAVKNAEPVGKGGVRSQNMSDSVKAAPCCGYFDGHVLGGVIS